MEIQTSAAYRDEWILTTIGIRTPPWGMPAILEHLRIKPFPESLPHEIWRRTTGFEYEEASLRLVPNGRRTHRCALTRTGPITGSSWCPLTRRMLQRFAFKRNRAFRHL